MGGKGEALSRRIESFRDEVISWVEGLSDADWNRKCAWEEWSVGVTARHLGGGHLAIGNLLAMIVEGEELPRLSMEQVNEMSKKDAREHSDATREEALALLRENGDRLAGAVAELSDEELERTGTMPAFGGPVSAEQLVEYVVFQSGREHLDSMKKAVGS